MNVFDKIKSSGLNIHELRRQNISHAEIANLVNDEIGGNVSKSSIIKYLKDVMEVEPTKAEKTPKIVDFVGFDILDFVVLSAQNLAQRIYIQSIDSLEDTEENINSQDVTILKNLLSIATMNTPSINHLKDRLKKAKELSDNGSSDDDF